jgi:hypothetical protein
VITVTVRGDKELILKLDRGIQATPTAMRSGLQSVGKLMERVSKKKLSGPSHSLFEGIDNPYPGVVSGALRSSVSHQVHSVAGGIEMRVGPGGFAEKYAAIQEFGGLAGRNHATRIPARPYMGPTLDENLKEAIRQLENALVKAYL